MTTAVDPAESPRDGPLFERLPARDACFLAFERTDLHMHVGATAIFEAGSLRLPSGELDIDRIRRYMTGRLNRIPRCRQRIARVPLFGAPVWVDDQHFDIAYHARLLHAPAPGGEAELRALAGDLISRPLDRARPLWEVWFIDGLADPDRFAVVVKFHHCMADGLAGIEFTRRFLIPSDDPTFDEPRPYVPRPLPGRGALLRHEVARWVRAPGYLLRAASRLVGSSEARADVRTKLGAVLATIRIGLRPTSKTALNRRVGPARRFDWTVIEVKDTRMLRRRYGGSLNDVSLGIVAGALERAFAAHGRARRPPRLRAMAPTSALTREQLQALGNRVYAPLVDLPLDEPDRERRLRRIQANTQALVRSNQGLGWDVLMELAEWTGVRSQQLSMWLAMKMRAYNIVMTLVPGPHFPLYLLGSKMLEVYPVLPLLGGQTATIGVLRYMGRLHWGIVSSPEYAEAFPALPPLVQESFAELLASARPPQQTAGAPDLTSAPG